MRSMRRANAGVTLMELLTVVVIIGILSAIAIPSYRAYVFRANRAEAKTGLLAMAGSLERCFTRNNTYLNCGLTIPLLAPSGKYQIDADGANGGIAAAAYALKATPQGSQTSDARCGTFLLDDRNTRNITGGTATAQECWGR